MPRIIIEDLEPGHTVTVMCDRVHFIYGDGPDSPEEKPEDEESEDLDLRSKARVIRGV